MAFPPAFRWLPSRATVLPKTTSLAESFTRLFSTSPMAALKSANPDKANKRKKKGGPQRSEHFIKVRTLRQNMFPPPPAPLRMARLRHLRHWTIHRAWLLFRRQQREAMEKERARMQAGMYNACEELRTVSGPGEDKGVGYLYRVAMEKKGVWGKDAVPIEYARYQTDYPGATPWNHDWKRQT
ncbi:uncharacterized protein F5Z01DRAFT_655427 [Emericellopsis atlantica]|uniref:Uncharacterized protein n=1 Tax=Emericellopsis atlantica TaxID=2614577 RepID=A0A9P8CPS2_9HYPO|nr:uncharacterized protein F5Z01DRAFT_655427 [Emericellopsis atlantica]KAG9254487.1 hypothetical protein F5Z01DRAFT_655427 [Emericellopsis atlantica]